MNWIRWNVPPIDVAKARASVVFPTPGTSSMSRWPRAMSAMTAWRIAVGLPRITRAMFASSAATSSAGVVSRSRGTAVLISSELYHRAQPDAQDGTQDGTDDGTDDGFGTPRALFPAKNNQFIVNALRSIAFPPEASPCHAS